jgi:hypothetical protein
MADPQITPTKFIEPIRCPNCSEMAYIIRRMLDDTKHDGSEIWAFQCVNGHTTEKPGRH